MQQDLLFASASELPGRIGIYYKNLVTGEILSYHADELYESASVIKLPVYAVIMRDIAEGKLDPEEKLLCREEDKLPSCGALSLFSGEVSADLMTLCRLMISLSDNSATNLLIRRMGIDRLNESFRELGLGRCRLERLLFDSEASAGGLENKVCPEEIGRLLEAIYRRCFVSPDVSEEMEALLRRQQVKHKIPGYLPRNIRVAHKTGEDTGITNDVGIVFAEEPFVLCFLSNETDVPRAERFLRQLSLDLVNEQKTAFKP